MKRKLKWVTNIDLEDFSVWDYMGYDVVTGRPVATSVYESGQKEPTPLCSVEELERMGVIGVYRVVVEDVEDVYDQFVANNGRPPCKQELALALLMSDFPDVAHVHFDDGEFIMSAPASDYHDTSIFGADSPLGNDIARLMGIGDENYRINFIQPLES